jgi:hypothetical protein
MATIAKKKPTAKQLAARKRFSEIMKNGGFKKNPIKRSGVSKKTYVSRPSQITKTAPSKRLKTRRAKHVDAGKPAGYFPNPLKSKRDKCHIVIGVLNGKIDIVSVFETLHDAKYYAHALASEQNKLSIKVFTENFNFDSFGKIFKN